MLGFYSIAEQPLSSLRNQSGSATSITSFSGISHYGQSSISKKTVDPATGTATALVYDVRSDAVTEFSYLVNGSIV